MPQRNWLRLIALSIFALASLAGAIYLHPRAFPIANVSFEVSRPEAGAAMSTFIEGLGHSLTGYRSTCSFGESSERKNFIDLQYGTGRVEEAARSGVNLWYWTGRWFKPGQREEWWARLSPSGEIVGFNHVIEEAAERPVLPSPEARVLAEEFLKTHFARHPWAKLKFVEESSQKRPARTDYTFTWEREDLRLDDAPYRLWVKVYGNEVGGYGEGLKVPEWWSRDFAKKREVNELCGTIAGYCLMPILLGAFVVLLIAIKNGQLRWRNSIPWRWLLFFGATAIASAVNSFPSSLFSYATTQNWSAFLSESAFSTLRGALGVILLFWLLTLITDRLYRQQFPEHLPLNRALGAGALRDPRTVRALGMGIVFALFSLTYVSLFYIVGQHWGIWCPVEVDYSKTIGGWLPWAEPLQTGLFAAFGEELLFRIIALVLIWRFVMVRWIAVVLSAAVWAFLHSSYPQMPGYARGIELTIGGIIWTVVFLRYGIVSTLTAHYLYNCWLGSAVLLQSPSWGNKGGALVVSLWPVALFVWGWLRKAEAPAHDHEPELEPASQATPPPLSAQPEPFDFSPQRLPQKQRLLLPAAAIVAIGLMMVIPQPQEKIASRGMLGLSREQILSKADEILRERGFEPERFRRIASLTSDGPGYTSYLLKHGTPEGLADLATKEWNDIEWRIRYFQILQQEEIVLYLDKEGRFATWFHTIPREATGAQLDREAALLKAQETLSKVYRLDLSRETLISDRLTQQENRRDWQFVFERKELPWGEAKLRTKLSIQGDEPVDFQKFIKVPEAWRLEQAKSGWRQFVTEELETWVSIVRGIIAGIYFVLLIRRNVVPWGLSAKLALFPLLFAAIKQINTIPQFYEGYTTTTPLVNYWIAQFGGEILMDLAGTYLGGIFIIGLTLGALRWAFNWTVKDLVLWPENREQRAQLWSDTLLIAFGAATLFALTSFANTTLGVYWFPTSGTGFDYPEVTGLVPWLGQLNGAIESGWDGAFSWAFKAGFYWVIWRRFPKAAWALFLIDPVLNNLGAENVPRFLFHWFFETLDRVLMAWMVIKVLRFNAAAIFLAFMGQSLVGSITLYLAKGGPNYQGQAAPLLLICLAAGIAGLIAHLRPQAAPVRVGDGSVS